MRDFHKVARIEGERLSDGSEVYSVIIAADKRYDIPRAITIGALSKAAACDIEAALNVGLAYVEVHGV